ncbi:TonB-dependent receptor plug domain-containing protein [Flavobacterium sp.]|uniref:TonB-dependent receptor plug domain-containing protein n=1 Tax=Flavobacterium sp. TaxID=239 RepID=UPI003D09E1DF
MKKRLFYLILFLCVGLSKVTAQTRVIGNVHSDKTDENLYGVKVILASPDEKVYYDQTFTDLVGNFSLKSRGTNAKLILRLSGYKTSYIFTETVNKSTDIGTIFMEEEIVKQATNESSLVDLAVIRKSPISSVTLLENQGFNTNSNKDFIERTSNIAGVYTTTMGGGYSDAQMRMRGYNQANITPILDGIALNNPETGLISWNFIAPNADALQSVQLQKGLGASKLVNASVAGTINFMLKDPFVDNGNYFSLSTGNNGAYKYAINGSLGNIKKGFGLNLALNHTNGVGYMNNTGFNATGYYLAMGFTNEKNRFVLKLLGSPQWHDMNNRIESLGKITATDGSIDAYYNHNSGMYNGQALNMYTQTSHVPTSTLEWEYKPNSKNSISLKAYSQLGFSSQTDIVGENPFLSYSPFQTKDRQIDFDYIRGYNTRSVYYKDSNNNDVPYYNWLYDNGQWIAYARSKVAIPNGKLLFLNSGYNTQRTTGLSLVENYKGTKVFGGLLNYQVQPFSFMKLNVGLDFRRSTYTNKRFVNNLFGADGYRFDPQQSRTAYTTDLFNAKDHMFDPFYKPKSAAVDYNNDNNITYGGAYTQVEFNFNKFNILAQGGYNRNEYYKRSYNLFNSEISNDSEVVKLDGYNAKIGVNWNISKNHNVWGNFGVVSRVPIFSYVFETYSINPNQRYINEKFRAAEIGYTFLSKKVNFNVSTYANRLLDSVEPFADSDGFWGISEGITKVNYGIELDGVVQLTKFLDVFTSHNFGVWKYDSDASFTNLQYDPQVDVYPEVSTLYVKDVKVGGAPQWMSSLGVNVKPFRGFNVKVNAKYHDLFYSNTAVEQFDPIWYETAYATKEMQLPSFTLLDASIDYELKLKNNQRVFLGYSMNNVLDTRYITESTTSFGNDQIKPNTNTTYGQAFPNGFKDINGANTAFFGFGRTWNFAVKYKF